MQLKWNMCVMKNDDHKSSLSLSLHMHVSDYSLEKQMMCMGHYNTEHPIYKKFIEKNKYICTNIML